MQLLRNIARFGASEDDLKNIYFLYVRSQLEQSAVVWHNGLTEENAADLERVQKTAVKIILKNKYIGYKKSLIKLDMETLHERRNQLSLNFAIKSTKNKKMRYMFQKNIIFYGYTIGYHWDVNYMTSRITIAAFPSISCYNPSKM